VVTVAALVVAAAAFVTFASAPTPAHAVTLASKQAQAAKLDGEVNKLERQFDELQERYRGAVYELGQINGDVAEAKVEVKSTQRSLRAAKMRLAQRAIAIYQTRSEAGQFVDFASSGSISDFFDKVEAVERVSEQDSTVLDKVDALHTKVEKNERALERAQAKSAQAKRRAERDKRAMGKLLDARKTKLSSVNADIRSIMEAQRRAAAAKAAAAALETASLADTSGARTGSGGGSSSSSSSSGGGGGSSIPLPPGSGTAAAAANAAMGKIGSPYVWAAAGPDSFDCSGLVLWAFAQAGRPGLPHSSYAFAGMGVDVPLDQLQVGDLVFPSGDGHMGMYVGGGSFVHAPHSGDVVKVTSMSDYQMSHARRI